MPNPQTYRQFDLSGAVQTASSRLLRKRNEVASSKNAEFNRKIGSASRRYGYEQVGRTIEHGKDGLGLHIYKYGTNNKILTGINNSDDSNTTVRYLDINNYWSNLITDLPANTRLNMLDFLEECYIAGRSSLDEYITLRNVDSSLNVSTSRNVFAAPKTRFIAEYNGRLLAINVEVNGVKYKDRAYLSSLPLGAVTFVQGDQKGLLQQLKVDSVKYLKPNMTIDIYGGSTNAKKIDSLTIISIDKVNNLITFTPTSLDLKDNDEIWLEDRKGKLSILWNTDHPTSESAEFIRVPPGTDENPEFTGFGKNNNRFFFFTRDSFLKWDGANLITISNTVGCVSHETICNIGAWTIWLHTTGVWAWNDSTGQLKLLSRAIDNYVKAINQTSLNKASAGVIGRVYKLSVGEIAELDSVTTSTSTSSTSTSSTSSSTSSTSTSSTSTSSTSISTSSTTTSTSTSSTSTSSTSTSSTSTSTSLSTSSTSTSISTSSTSTSTSTIAPSGKNVVRLVYDFDMNAWWPEYHKREIRFQINHTMHGYTKPYFLDDTGRLFRDETGWMDHNDTIPFEVELGRNNLGSEQRKNLIGAYIESENASGAQVLAVIDNQHTKNIGQLNEDIVSLPFPAGTIGREVNYKITHNSNEAPPVVDGVVTHFSYSESSYTNR